MTNLRIEIVGDLSGAGVGSIEQAWRTANSVLAGRRIVVGLTAVAEADDYGRGLLLTWHRCGARIIARSMDSCTLAESILGTSVPIPPAKSGWRQRFSDFLRRWSAAATKMAHASKRFGSVAAHEQWMKNSKHSPMAMAGSRLATSVLTQVDLLPAKEACIDRPRAGSDHGKAEAQTGKPNLRPAISRMG
jgi:hypothetical protein